MAANPWHPRVTPFFVYILFFAVIGGLPDDQVAWYPLLYVIQCLLVVGLLWRYRKLTPELNFKFHWLALPTGLALCAAWVGLGFASLALARAGEALPGMDGFFQWLIPPADGQPHRFERLEAQAPGLYWPTLALRLLGMSLVVPFFEELFTRSALLRGFANARKSAIGIVQLASDLPLIGDWLTHTAWGRKAGVKHGMFTDQLEATAVGVLSIFGVTASTFVFMLNHGRRDWLGCIACGLVWCALLGWTNRRSLAPDRRLGLGPIIWSHAITNAALWGYTVWTDDWQFL